MKRLIVFLCCLWAVPAISGTILYSDFVNLANQVTVKIEHNSNGQQFIVYKTHIKMSATASPFLVCEAREIIDPPGTWTDTGDITLSALFTTYFALPNSKTANNGNPDWCTQ
jgi:hypothetical protein